MDPDRGIVLYEERIRLLRMAEAPLSFVLGIILAPLVGTLVVSAIQNPLLFLQRGVGWLTTPFLAPSVVVCALIVLPSFVAEGPRGAIQCLRRNLPLLLGTIAIVGLLAMAVLLFFFLTFPPNASSD